MDAVVYYRLTDGVVVGSTIASGRINDREEVTHYGPGVAALHVPEVEFRAGTILTVVGGQLRHVVDAAYLAAQAKKRQDQQIVLAKLGLTEDERASLVT